MKLSIPNLTITATVILMLCMNLPGITQVSINPTGTPPHATAILDLTSTSKGVLIPRMSTGDRNLIMSPATGLLIYNTTNNKYNFYSGAAWVELASGTSNKIVDTDNDTRVDVETGPDVDYISMQIAGNERVAILSNRIEMFFPGGSIAIGEESGTGDDGTFNQNTSIGTSAGASMTTGEHNVNIGANAGTNNAVGSENTFLGFNAGLVSQSSNNLFAGAHSGETNTTGNDNVFLGKDAGRMNVVGDFNVMIGSGTGLNNTASGNTFVGTSAGSSNTTGTSNTLLGFGSGNTLNNTSFNTMIGNNAGANSELGERNTFLGFNSGQDTQGSLNTFVGSSAGETNQSGAENTYVGESAGYLNSTGSNNTFLGRNAGRSSTTSSGNTFVGRNAGMNNGTGASNTFIGQNAGTANTASNNTFVGQESGNANSSGANNSFLGQRAGFTNSTGASNTFLGTTAGQSNSTGSNNTFVGRGAGDVNTSSNNTFLGMDAGGANTTGAGNTFVGKNAGLVNTTATQNTFVGLDAGKSNTASSNTFVGNSAGPFNTIGFENTFLGFAAGGINTNGDGNVFLGVNSGGNNTTADFNTFVGAYSGTLNSTGTANAFFGEHAGFSNTTGSHNTFIGNQARPTVGTLTNATAIGDSALVGASNTLILGNKASVGIGTSAPEPSAKTEIKSSTQGFLMPRMSSAQRKAIVSPAVGLMVFDLDKTALYFFDGVAWLPMTYTPEILLPPTTRYSSDSQEGDYFGYAVAIDGDYAIVGAPGHDGPVPGTLPEGAAYIFKRTNGACIQETTLLANDAAASDLYGWSVDIFGDYAIVGAPGDDQYTGSVYIYFRTGNTWNLQAKKMDSTASTGDQFGYSVSTIGTKAVVGAPNDDIGGDTDTGSARLFNRSGTTWTEGQFFSVFSNASDVWFGYSVSMIDNYIAFGAPHEGNNNEGRVHLYFFNGTTWVGQFTQPGDNINDFYGYAVSLDGLYLAIGIPQFGGASDGEIELRRRNGTAWEPQFVQSFATPGGSYGQSVAVGDNYLVVGDPEAKRSYIFRRNVNNDNLYLREIKDPDPTAPNTQLGLSLAADGFNILAASPGSPCSLCPQYKGKVFFLNLE